MTFLTEYARKERLKFIQPYINKTNYILDLGCGDMAITLNLRNQGYKTLGVDLESGDVRSDARNLPFKDHIFDRIIMFELLEHVDCLNEALRVLKSGGYLFITTPEPKLNFIIELMAKYNLIQELFTPHINLVNLKDLKLNLIKYKRKFFGLNQFGIIKKVN